MDEQHSRSQRKFGAPYCTASFLNQHSLICLMVNVDDNAVKNTTVLTKAGKAAKSKAKVAHCEGMAKLVTIFKDSESSLRHFCCDQSSDGLSDAETHFRKVWEGFRVNFDIWHKTKEFDSLWKTFCSRRVCPRGVSSCFIFLSFLSSRAVIHFHLSICFSISFPRRLCTQRAAIPLLNWASSCLSLQGSL